MYTVWCRFSSFQSRIANVIKPPNPRTPLSILSTVNTLLVLSTEEGYTLYRDYIGIIFPRSLVRTNKIPAWQDCLEEMLRVPWRSLARHVSQVSPSTHELRIWHFSNRICSTPKPKPNSFWRSTFFSGKGSTYG